MKRMSATGCRSLIKDMDSMTQTGRRHSEVRDISHMVLMAV